MATHDVMQGTGTPPRFSILTVVRQADPKHLLELIYSLIHQRYEGWECIFIENEAARSRPRVIMKAFQKRDCRFSLRKLDTRQSDLYCLDYGLQFITGNFVVVVEDTGMLSSGALHEVASLLMRRPHIDAVFTDEAMMDDEGVIHASCFKAGCPAEELVRQAHRQPLAFLSKMFLTQCGGFAAMQESRKIEAIRAEHIPHSLYHRRDLQSRIRRRRLALKAGCGE